MSLTYQGSQGDAYLHAALAAGSRAITFAASATLVVAGVSLPNTLGGLAIGNVIDLRGVSGATSAAISNDVLDVFSSRHTTWATLTLEPERQLRLARGCGRRRWHGRHRSDAGFRRPHDRAL
jgi:hypothetical protein